MIPALSLRQPWAWFVLHAGKHVENRTWNTRFRGPFLIHAAKGMTRDEYEDACAWAQDVLEATDLERLGSIQVPRYEEMLRGGIVGRARLVDVISPDAEPSLFGPTAGGCGRHWHMHNQHGFVLTDVEPLPFKPCKGALGFFDPETGRKVA